LDVKPETGIPLVIPEDDIVARHMSLYESILENEGLFLCGCEEVIQAFGLVHHQGRFMGKLTGRFEIGQDPFLEVLGLTHIDNLIGSVFKDINARPFR
jgi:hypothetical protein